MEFDEVIYLVVIIWLVNQWVVGFLLGVILSGGGGGMDMMAGAGMGLGVGGGGGDDSAEVSHDQEVKHAMSLYDLPEARAWLGESTNRIFGEMGRGETDQLINTIYDTMGAKKVYVNASGSQAGAIYIELPKDKDKRKQLLDLHAKHTEDPPLKDKGQKWLVFEW
jgi:hypothetical protein